MKLIHSLGFVVPGLSASTTRTVRAGLPTSNSRIFTLKPYFFASLARNSDAAMLFGRPF
jgi:hypothetical protein